MLGLFMNFSVQTYSKKKGTKVDDKKKKDPSVVKVSQPISRAGMPTQHAASRADYLKSHNAMSSPTQMLPPQNPPSQDIPQNNNATSNNIHFAKASSS